jgi:hypothetical protein
MTTQIRSKAINPSTECNTVSPYAALLIGSSRPSAAPMLRVLLMLLNAGRREFRLVQREFLNTSESGGQPAFLRWHGCFCSCHKQQPLPAPIKLLWPDSTVTNENRPHCTYRCVMFVAAYGGQGEGGVGKRKHGPHLASVKLQRTDLGVHRRILLWSKQSCPCA